MFKMNLNKSFSLKQASEQAIINLLAHLSSLITAGIPILQAIKTTQISTKHAALKACLCDIEIHLRNGSPLSNALKHYPHYFDTITCELIKTGEATGNLEAMLEHIIVYKEKNLQLKNHIKKALFYPLSILCIALIVTIFMLIFIVPQFALLFKDFGGTLPTATLCVIALSNFIKQFGVSVLLSIFLLWAAYSCLKKHNANFALYIDMALIKLPLIGDFLKQTITARLANALSLLISAGIPLLNALENSQGLAGNQIYTLGLKFIGSKLHQGESFSKSLKQTGLFPSLMLEMVAIGEETGKLDTLLKKTAVFFEQNIERKLAYLCQLLEPITMVILSVIIGGLVIAMYLPIFKLGTIIG